MPALLGRVEDYENIGTPELIRYSTSKRREMAARCIKDTPHTESSPNTSDGKQTRTPTLPARKQTDIERYNKARMSNTQSCLENKGRRANMKAQETMKHKEEAVVNSKNSAEGGLHWKVTTQARTIHDADTLLGCSAMLQDLFFDAHSASTQD